MLPFRLERPSTNTITNTRMGRHSCIRETFVDGLLPHKPQVGSCDFSHYVFRADLFHRCHPCPIGA